MAQELMRDEEIGLIAAAVNRRIDAPFLNEAQEGRILFKVIKRIDQFLWQVLPDELYELYRTAVDGLDGNDADMLKERLVTIINKYVDLPFLSEETEKKLFEFVLGIVCDAIRKGRNLILATKEA